MLGDIVDAELAIPLRLVVIVGVIATVISFKKNPDLGVNVGGGFSVLIMAYHFFPAFTEGALAILVCLFFIWYGIFR